MNFTVTVMIMLALLTLAKTVEKKTEKMEKMPLLVEILQKLHREPPEELIARSRASVESRFLIQQLDHFDPNNTNTWKMRFLINEEHFKAGSPMFIHLGGEWAISPGRLLSGIVYDLAKEHKGILFYTEHRYYGVSKPTSDLSVENMKYLNVKQALADIAYFINFKRTMDSRLAKSKVIISGCSYSANMVVWFSKLYPELVNGGFASSAPLLAQVDFKEFMEVVGQALVQLGSQQCYDRVQNGIAELEAMSVTNRSHEMIAMLNFCDSFNNESEFDMWSLFAAIAHTFAAVVQYQKRGDIPFQCDYLMSFDDDVTAIVNFTLKHYGNVTKCKDISYEHILEYYLKFNYDMGAAIPWFYQGCNEFGGYASSGSANQPFGSKFPAIVRTRMCNDILGPNYTIEYVDQLIAETNEFFGGKNLQVENIYMTYGTLDPWSTLGLGVGGNVSMIPLASHCADFGSISSGDSAEMRASKKRLFELVRKWVA